MAGELVLNSGLLSDGHLFRHDTTDSITGQQVLSWANDLEYFVQLQHHFKAATGNFSVNTVRNHA